MIDLYQGYDYVDKVLTLTEGAYKVKDINAIIQQTLPNEEIKLVDNQGSGKCNIFLKQ